MKKSTISKITAANLMRISDPFGKGHFGASRGAHTHQGVDIITKVGENILAPIDGTITRFPSPYGTDLSFKGIEIKNADYHIKIFYVNPKVKIGDKITQGQVIAVAQNIAAKYGPTMINHAHIEVRTAKGELLDYQKLV